MKSAPPSNTQAEGTGGRALVGERLRAVEVPFELSSSDFLVRVAGLIGELPLKWLVSKRAVFTGEIIKRSYSRATTGS